MQDTAAIRLRGLLRDFRRAAACLVILLATAMPARAQLNPANFTPLDSGGGLTGSLTIVTNAAGGSLSDGVHIYNAVSVPQAGGPNISVFTFNDISIASNAVINVSGTNPFALLSEQNFYLAANILANGLANTGATGGAANLGGSAGGNAGQAGQGAGGGAPATGSGYGGGGGFAGAGGTSVNAGSGVGGATYGTQISGPLRGGSGGGGSSAVNNLGGGSGGGAFEIGAVGTISITPSTGSLFLSANGGSPTSGAAAGGSGGQIRIHGTQVTVNSSNTYISAAGGGSTAGGAVSGGGGRISIDGISSISIGATNNMSVGGGGSGTGPNIGLAGQITFIPNITNVDAGTGIVLNGQPVVRGSQATGGDPRLEYIVQRDLHVNNGGYAELGINNPLNSSANLNISGTGLFDTKAFTQTVSTLSGDGTLRIESGGKLTLANSFTQHLTFTGQVLGPGTFEKAGSGALVVDNNLAVGGSILNSSGSLIVNGSSLTGASGVANSAGAVLQLTGVGASIVGPTLTNYGQLVGTGTLNANLLNQASGVVQVQALQAEVFTGTANSNSGTISLLGGTAQFTGPFTNSATSGLITGRGTLITGAAGLTNNGFMAFSGGMTDVLGNVLNNATGHISTVGGATTSFYGNFVHNALSPILTGAGSHTVFLGAQTGAGSFSGSGTVEYYGALLPGNSPAAISYGGDVILGNASALTIELAGHTAGSQYDTLNIAGEAHLSGAINISLLNGFIPSLGDVFSVISYGSRSGDFATYSGLNVGGHLTLHHGLFATGLTLTACPSVDGDINTDGVVNGLDIASVASNWLQTSIAGDANGDGIVNGLDIAMIASNWLHTDSLSQSSAASDATATVPEPSTFALAALALIFLSPGIRRHWDARPAASSPRLVRGPGYGSSPAHKVHRYSRQAFI